MNIKATDAFIRTKLEIDTLLARLQGLSDDHFNTNPDAINWGHVGDIERIRNALRLAVEASEG
jgi:hypothetical protein